MAKLNFDTITLSKEMLHEVLCTELHGKVPNAWTEAEKLVTAIEKGALAEVNEPKKQSSHNPDPSEGLGKAKIYE